MKTLLCIRELPHSQATVHFGGVVAALAEGPLTLMTVMTENESRTEAEARLAQARQQLPIPTVESKIRRGEPAAEILAEARSESYGLIIVGRRAAASLIQNLFLQPVARTVAKQASICVLIVNEDRPSLQRMLICTGGHELDKKVIRAGAELAAVAKARVTLLHVTNPVPSMYTGLDAMEERLEELLQTDTPLAEHLREGARMLAEYGVEAELRLRHGVATDEILREIRKGQYDLLVIGPGPVGSPLRRLMMDDVTPQLIDNAPCPVLIVRDGCL